MKMQYIYIYNEILFSKSKINCKFFLKRTELEKESKGTQAKKENAVCSLSYGDPRVVCSVGVLLETRNVGKGLWVGVLKKTTEEGG